MLYGKIISKIRLNYVNAERSYKISLLNSDKSVSLIFGSEVFGVITTSVEFRDQRSVGYLGNPIRSPNMFH